MNKYFLISLLAVLVLVVACSPVEELDEIIVDDEVVDAEVPQEEEEQQDEIAPESDENLEQEIRVIQVDGEHRSFTPNLISIEVGETIEFVFNNLQGTHDFVIPELGVGTDIIGTGQTDSFIYTFEEAGEFDFECTVGNHAAEGMVGRIVVS